ncbi:MAG: hypothetical protein M3R02_19060 [Chloroflexota bacterium]|nr:hypothetical protein [Chloroflexota bacterium]
MASDDLGVGDARDRTFLARYGATILRGGIAAIPAALFRYQGELGLTAPQVWFVCTILSHKWNADLPHPSLSKLSEQTGISRQQLQNHQRQLIAGGWLHVVSRQNALGGQDTNYYDFSPLFAALESLLQRDHTPRPVEYPPAKSTWHPPAKSAEQAPAKSTWQHSEARTETRAEETGASNFEGPRPDVSDDARTREALSRFIADMARELNDKAPLSSSLTRVVKLYRASGLSLDDFTEAMYAARARTQEHSAGIRSTDTAGVLPRKRKMAYFLAVLEDLVRCGRGDRQRLTAD